MYAILPLSCPSRVVCDAARRLARRRSRGRARRRRRRRGCSAARRRDGRCPSGSPRSFFASCAACRPWSDAGHDRRDDARRHALAARRERRIRRASDSPCDVLHDEEELAVASRRRRACGTTFGWRMRAASRASSRNIATNSGSLANCGWSRLIATVREKPTGPSRRPRCTVAMPPAAISP